MYERSLETKVRQKQKDIDKERQGKRQRKWKIQKNGVVS